MGALSDSVLTKHRIKCWMLESTNEQSLMMVGERTITELGGVQGVVTGEQGEAIERVGQVSVILWTKWLLQAPSITF